MPGELEIIIRRETQADQAAIAAITRAAFQDHPHSQQTEEFIVSALRQAGALTLSLVAQIDGQVVGHIAFSPATISGRSQGWHGVGPVSVTPPRQRQGIGKALVQEGLRLLRQSGAQGCVLVGDPGYYQRFGFRNIPQLVLEGVPQEYFLALPLGTDIPHGAVEFHEGFKARG